MVSRELTKPNLCSGYKVRVWHRLSTNISQCPAHFIYLQAVRHLIYPLLYKRFGLYSNYTVMQVMRPYIYESLFVVPRLYPVKH